MQTLFTTYYVALILTAAASPITVSTSTSVSGTSFVGDTPPRSHLLSGLAVGITVAGLLTGAGVVGAGRYCCQKREADRTRRYQEYQEDRAFEEVEGKGSEDTVWNGAMGMGMPKKPRPIYTALVRGEDIDQELV